MTRREFVCSSAALAGTAVAWDWPQASPATGQATNTPRKFKLNYAPHFGMFTQHAGNDLVAQLEFMRAEGFTGLEDNDLRRRQVDVQETIGKTLDRLGMRMGVFVGHNINWKEPTLTTRDDARRQAFL